MSHVAFFRDFRSFSGGHLKVWHYFNHVLASEDHDASIRFSRQTIWDATNPWGEWRPAPTRRWPRRTAEADVLFLGGLDWLTLRPADRDRGRRPVINLVQHVRHADPGDQRYRFLSHPAIRIGVSEEVTSAIVATGGVRGPVFTIPNAVDVGPQIAEVGAVTAHRDIDVLVVANKRPDLGGRVHDRIRRGERVVHLLDGVVPRPVFLDHLRRARVTVFVPGRTEGFYLPALEGMALGTLVVCADCVGNRSFCLPGENCLRPEADEDALVRAVEHACSLSPAAAAKLREGAHATAARHDLTTERKAFLDILADIDDLWASAESTVQA